MMIRKIITTPQNLKKEILKQTVEKFYIDRKESIFKPCENCQKIILTFNKKEKHENYRI